MSERVIRVQDDNGWFVLFRLKDTDHIGTIYASQRPDAVMVGPSVDFPIRFVRLMADVSFAIHSKDAGKETDEC